jgi:zinc protease
MAKFLRCAVFLFVAIVACTASPFPREESDLPPDPALRQGQLPNGLHYAILPNFEPKDRVSLRFVVLAGSLNENDNERGLAHFVEHMAFRSTHSYPADSMITALQRLGIGTGPDSGAFTLYDYTIYHLELPDARDETLQTGLRVFREFADGVTFDTKLIERERGVVLSEKALRDTPDARSGRTNLAFLWPASRHVRRDIIGTDDAIKRFSRAQFVSFYNAWYRPERMAVIVVGDISADTVVRRLTEIFGSLAAHGSARPVPVDLIARQCSAPSVDGFIDPGLPGITLTFEHPIAKPREADTHARRVVALQQALAFAMFQQRLAKFAHERNGPVVAPTTSLIVPLPEWQLATVTVSGTIDTWKAVAAGIEQEHRRVFLHGFTERELTAARARLAMEFDEATRTAGTRRSETLVGQLASAVIYGTAFPTPLAVQSDLAVDLAAATLQDCRNAFREAWTSQPPHVFVQGNSSFHVTRGELSRTLNESRRIQVSPPGESAALTFAYDDFGPPGRLVREEHASDLDVYLAEFANGVRLNAKSTTFEADTVYLAARVGDGMLSQPPDCPGLDWLADSAVTGGGVRKHSTEELNELLAGRAVTLQFAVEGDACVFFVRCARRDLTLGLQLITAYLTDAAWRPSALSDAHAWFGTRFSELASSAGGPITLRALRTMLVDERRFGTPELDELNARNLDELTRWIEPQFKTGPIELSVVGDAPWPEINEAVGHTLGALPPRAARASPAAVARTRFAAPPPKPEIFLLAPTFKQAAISWYWPVPVPVGIHQERRSDLLARILADRLRVRLREELGAAYASTAYFVRTDAIPTLNYFTLYAEVNATQIIKAAGIVKREVAALRTAGIGEDEFARARQPYLHAMEDYLQTNTYWSQTVLIDAQQRPERLAAARDRATDLAAITRPEVEELARRYLDPIHGFMFVAEAPPIHFWGTK